MTQTIGIGVVGFGWMGLAHSRSYRRIPMHFPEADLMPHLVIVADNVPERAELAQQNFGFDTATEDWRAVVDHPDVDVVTIGAPNKLHREIAIAAAGPLVSLALAGLAFVSLIPLALIPPLPAAVYVAASLLFQINLMLALFNLVPALPMDGGRVLRGILALKRDHLTATIIAAKVGRILAVIGLVFALFQGSFSLGLISVFVYIAAGSEVRMAQLRAYQERAADFPFAGPGGGRSWHWSWSSGQSSRSARPSQTGSPAPRTPPTRSGDWSESGIDADRNVVVVGGKAEIISRKDPDSKD